jgi:hypothetical protein
VRQLNSSTNLLLAVIAGLGLLGSLSLNWFAAPVPSPATDDGAIEDAAFQFGHVFATHAPGMVTGSAALGVARGGLVLLVVVVAFAGLAVGTPSIRQRAEGLMRVVAIAAPIVVLVAAIAHPGVSTPVRIHYGTLVAFAVSLFMASAAWQGAAMRVKSKAPVRPRYGSAR